MDCRSQEGQAHRLLCSPVVKQWRSVANTALFPHGCSACRGRWRGLLRFTVLRKGLLEDTQLPRTECRHTVHSTRGFQRQMQEPPGVCVTGQLFNFTLFFTLLEVSTMRECIRSRGWESQGNLRNDVITIFSY